MNTTKDTRYPLLTAAVIEQIGDADTLADVARHGADAGYPGFTYYSDTLKFFEDNRGEIMAMAKQMADDMGEDVLAMIAGFNCLKCYKITPYEVSEAIHTADSEHSDTVRNALAWFAAEEVARELNPDI